MLSILAKLLGSKGGLLGNINEFHFALAGYLTWLDERMQGDGNLTPEEISFLEAGRQYADAIGGAGVGLVSKNEIEATESDSDASEISAETGK